MECGLLGVHKAGEQGRQEQMITLQILGRCEASEREIIGRCEESERERPQQTLSPSQSPECPRPQGELAQTERVACGSGAGRRTLQTEIRSEGCASLHVSVRGLAEKGERLHGMRGCARPGVLNAAERCSI